VLQQPAPTDYSREMREVEWGLHHSVLRRVGNTRSP
jgi:hypothetical protein